MSLGRIYTSGSSVERWPCRGGGAAFCHSYWHPVFHVSQLKKVISPHKENKDEIPMLTENYEWKAVPDEVYGYLKNKAGSWDVLISWKGLPRHEATWELYENMQHRFPDFHLEDKVNLEKECNDRPPILHQYSRRKKEIITRTWRAREGNNGKGLPFC